MFSTQLSNQQLSSTPFQGLTPRCWPYQGPRVQIKIRGTWLQFMTLARLCVGVWCSCLFFKTPTLPKKMQKCQQCVMSAWPSFLYLYDMCHWPLMVEAAILSGRTEASCFPPASAPSFQVVDTPLVNPQVQTPWHLISLNLRCEKCACCAPCLGAKVWCRCEHGQNSVDIRWYFLFWVNLVAPQ